jgi:hypothetical protein
MYVLSVNFYFIYIGVIMKEKLVVEIGDEFGDLTLIGQPFLKRKESANRNLKYALFRCKCGKEKCIRYQDVVYGGINSCGCRKTKNNIKMNTTHGLRNHRLYHIWQAMINRCYRDDFPSYKYYGNRGVYVCDEWKNSVKAFYEWAMNNGYQDNLTIDRMDNDEGYTPYNCRWVTRKENMQNRGTTKIFA